MADQLVVCTLASLHAMLWAQEHWFVLCALLKDQLGVLLEEDITARPSCPACRRTNCSVTLDKVA